MAIFEMKHDYSDEAVEIIYEKIRVGLERCGMKAEGYAKKNLKKNRSVDSGLLRNSITYSRSGMPTNISSYTSSDGTKSGTYTGKAPGDESDLKVYIGSNVEYAPFLELGTGVNYPGGRRTPWGKWQDKNGDWHQNTTGMQARPYLKPAIVEHSEEYKKILDREIHK